MREKKVIILGGGVGGLCSAWHLSQRGFDVTIYEPLSIPGGKARSMPFPKTGTDGRKDLPGEHGFRIFPNWYRHLSSTLQQIPSPRGGTVYDQIVGTDQIQVARFKKPPLFVPARLTLSPQGIHELLHLMFDTDPGFKAGELEFFADRVWQILTSCKERRLNQYEKISWWEYTDAENKSDAYKNMLVSGLTRSLVASRPKTASTRTVGDIFAQMLLGILTPFSDADRVLSGPTNDVWIRPMLETMTSRYKVKYHDHHELVGINTGKTEIDSVQIKNTASGETKEIKGDYYIFALAPGILSKFLLKGPLPIAPAKSSNSDSDSWTDLAKLDPTLRSIPALHTSWMNGIQIYLKKDIKLAEGHTIYAGSPWSITSISQPQFWKENISNTWGNGKVNGIISTIISNWDEKGVYVKKAAKDCTAKELKEEIWETLKATQTDSKGAPLLSDELLFTSATDKYDSFFIDSDIEFHPGETGTVKTNTQPLLVNVINSWHLRPRAYTQIPNMFIASDYVATNTDLATMEGTDEAARRVTNALLDQTGSDESLLKIYDLHEPDILIPFRRADRTRLNRGQPWDGSIFASRHHIEYGIRFVLFFVRCLVKWVVKKLRGH